MPGFQSVQRRQARRWLPAVFALFLAFALAACAPAAAPTPTTAPAKPLVLATPTATVPAVAPATPTTAATVAAATPTTAAIAPATPTTAATVVAATATATAAAGTPAAARPVTVTLATQSNSGVAGTAMLTDLGGGRTRVVINQTGPTGNYPAHIHEGTCANLNPAPKHPLQNVQNGTSTTEVSAPLADLMRAPMAINLHKSAEDIRTYVACGEIK